MLLNFDPHATNHQRTKQKRKHTRPNTHDPGNRQDSDRTSWATLQPATVHRDRD